MIVGSGDGVVTVIVGSDDVLDTAVVVGVIVVPIEISVKHIGKDGGRGRWF